MHLSQNGPVFQMYFEFPAKIGTGYICVFQNFRKKWKNILPTFDAYADPMEFLGNPKELLELIKNS